MKPLQTHGQYREKWIPPNPDRFTIYESLDESWLRPLGFGRIERTLESLYDVRTGGDMRLVGYCRVNPVDRYDIRLAVTPEYERWDSDISKIASPQFDEITLRVRHYAVMRYVQGSGYVEHRKEVFVCWVAEMQDVEKLLATTWLTFGGDNMQEFLYELKRDMYERRIR